MSTRRYVKSAVLTTRRRICSNRAVRNKSTKTKAAPTEGGKVTFPPTTMRLDPELVYRAEKLALENKRAGAPEKTISKVVNAALAAYLKAKGA